jgi:hypothetical protein
VLVLGAGAVILVIGLWLGKPLWSGDTGQVAGSQPPGPAPPGKVWSPEHGHWHDVSPTTSPVSAQPPGPAPPGKVWSPEHGHWHDVSPAPVVADSTAVDSTEAGNE